MNAWKTPTYSPQDVDQAGRKLVNPNISVKESDEALEIVNNFRAAHNFPLNTLQVWLRNNAKPIDPHCIVAQRIKRLFSIKLKLNRIPTLKLSRMQDIGGCRAVVESVGGVYSLFKKYEKSRFRHRLDKVNDYIKFPKESGYRGIHLIYAYNSDRNDTYNGKRIEVQLRTPLQHAWATAVESVGTYTRQVLKAGEGEEVWKEFFRLMGTVIAKIEGEATIPNTPTDDDELKFRLLKYREQVDDLQKIKMLGQIIERNKDDFGSGDYILLKLNSAAQTMFIERYKDAALAAQKYSDAEKVAGVDAVLVSMEDIKNLKRAYPNYFLDIGRFMGLVHQVIK